MRDELKQYVNDHRDDFDVHHPREQLWEGINEQLQRGRSKALWQWLAAAASVLLVVTCGLFWGTRHAAISDATTQAQPSMTQAESYFAAVMQAKDAQLGQYCSYQPDLCREFEHDIASLTNTYQQLKKEYAVSDDKQAILRAMAANLQMQVQLINQQLQIMEIVKEKKSASNVI